MSESPVSTYFLYNEFPETAPGEGIPIQLEQILQIILQLLPLIIMIILLTVIISAIR